MIDVVLKQAGITDCFAVTISGEEVAAGKPAPDVYLTATRLLGVDPADAAAVEDSTNGLRAAAAAGMVVIASPNRKYPPEPDALASAALVVESLDEMTLDAIESAAQGARTTHGKFKVADTIAAEECTRQRWEAAPEEGKAQSEAVGSADGDE